LVYGCLSEVHSRVASGLGPLRNDRVLCRASSCSVKSQDSNLIRLGSSDLRDAPRARVKSHWWLEDGLWPSDFGARVCVRVVGGIAVVIVARHWGIWRKSCDLPALVAPH
jgi:hypothetical protein